MIVDDLNICRTVFGPSEANPPLIVDPDRMLAFSILGQAFQAITRRYPQVVELFGGLNRFQLPSGYPEYPTRKALGTKPVKDRLRDLVLEPADHGQPHRLA
jgi:hypothetical protein